MTNSAPRHVAPGRLLWSLALLAAGGAILAFPVEFFADPDWTSAGALWLLYPLLPFVVAAAAALLTTRTRRVMMAWLAGVFGYLAVAAIAFVDPDPLGIVILVFLSPVLVTLLVVTALTAAAE